MGKGSGQSDDPAEEERRKKREEDLTDSPMTARRLALTMKRSQKMHPDIPYVFLLGAGCSRSSGILLASELVKDVWMPEIQKELELKPDEYPSGYDPDDPGAWYSSAVAQLFQTADRQQTEFARLTRDTRPGYGYYVFSELMATHRKQFSTVLTTNFDNLLVDALTFFQGSQPLVVYHSQLIRMATPEREHPAIIKLHNDVFYSPRNTQEDLSSLDDDLVSKVADLLRHRPLIIMGYSGNDPTVLKLLQACDTEMEVYWVGSSLPGNDNFRRWLTSDNVKAQWVKHGDFDRLMLEVAGVFEMKGGPDRRKVLKRLDDVEDHYRTVSSGLIDETRESTGDEDKPSEGAMAYLAYQEASLDPGAGDKVFKEALVAYPGSPNILGIYAVFLEKQNRMEEAEEHYRRALKADSEDANHLGNYALFLQKQKRMEEAEEHYRRALKADPEHANNLGNYAGFLQTQNRIEEAEERYRRALKADPEHANHLGNYSNLLKRQNRMEEAEEYYGRALKADPEHANNRGDYAGFLQTQNRIEEAEENYRRALKANPEHANSLGNYAVFLQTQNRMEEAEENYRRALKANPEHANSLGNYAVFLQKQNRMEEAEEHYRRALKADPEHAGHLGNYIEFLFQQGRAPEGEEAIERLKGIEGAEKDAGLLCVNLVALALHPERSNKDTLLQIKDAIQADQRLATWDFEEVIKKARQDGHPDIALLSDLADVINEKQEPSILEEYEVWKKA